MKIMCIFGTRPEAVKMCPLILEIEKQEDMDCVVCLSGQHRDMLAPALDLFGIRADYTLDIMRPNQSLTDITCGVLAGVGEALEKEQPDIALVHGDTTTSFAAALAAFYQKIPVGHVEAGLRSHDLYSPYPEELNRSLTARIAELHFAPTIDNKRNLLEEGVTGRIAVTGNTVIDAFRTTLREAYSFQNEALRSMAFAEGKWILLTAHRRENLGRNLEQICRAVKRIVRANPEVRVIYPMHPNPAVRNTALELLDGEERIYLTEPLEVQDMHNLIRRSYLVLTDSGGLQEEAPACGIPVLVLRTETERPEAVEAGTVRIAGVEEDEIVRLTELLLGDGEEYRLMASAVNPYGDGRAAAAIVKELRRWGRERAYESGTENRQAQ